MLTAGGLRLRPLEVEDMLEYDLRPNNSVDNDVINPVTRSTHFHYHLKKTIEIDNGNTDNGKKTKRQRDSWWSFADTVETLTTAWGMTSSHIPLLGSPLLFPSDATLPHSPYSDLFPSPPTHTSNPPFSSLFCSLCVCVF